MQNKLTLITTMAALLAGSTAFADTIPYPAARVSIDMPDRWTSQVKGDSILLADAKGDVAVSFVPVDAGSIKTATKAVARYLEHTVTKLKLTGEKAITINGMPAVVIDGDGFLGTTNIDLSIVIVDTPSEDKDLLIVALAEDAKLARHRDEILSVFNHLRPSR